MSRLIGKLVECTDFPREICVIKMYNPDTGMMSIETRLGIKTVHISKCKVVKKTLI